MLHSWTCSGLHDVADVADVGVRLDSTQELKAARCWTCSVLGRPGTYLPLVEVA